MILRLKINRKGRIKFFQVTLLTDMLLFLTALCYSTFARFFEMTNDINEETRIDAYGVFHPEIMAQVTKV